MSTLEEYKEKYAPELIQALDEFHRIHAPEGFVSTVENGQALILHLAQNNMPPTLASLEQSAKMHTPELGYKMYYTAEEQAFNAVRAQYDANTLAIFDHWFSYQHIEKTPRAAAAILSECRGHKVDKEFLDLALGRAASKGKIVFLKAPGQDAYVPGQYSGKDLKDTVKPEEMTDVFGKRLHPTQAHGQAGEQYRAKLERDAETGRAPSEQTEQYWIERAHKATGANLASTKVELTRIVVTENGKISWEKTALAREKMQAGIGSR
jgi:hypothetical protein